MIYEGIVRLNDPVRGSASCFSFWIAVYVLRGKCRVFHWSECWENDHKMIPALLKLW